MAESNNKTIAKNTLLLYFRMIVTMAISLYTSRVILQILGVDDYGIYQSVGGIVGFLSFLNAALATGSSRFITFGLGKGDENELKSIFSTTLSAHICLAFIIVVIGETAGLWFLYNRLIIPPERMDAAIYTFHLSILTSFFSLTQVPYNATIIAHERMNVYAYVSIFDAVARLLIVYLLLVGDFDKLKLYATLLTLLQISILLFYRYYCSHHFSEAKFKISIDTKIFKEIASFSGWSLFANSAYALSNQGILVLLNVFFAPAVVTARSISIQVNMAANQLVTNFQTAVNPQIVKRYAAGDYSGSKELLLQTAKFSYFLMLLIGLPIYLTAESLLQLWLGVVPEYTVIFLKIIVFQSLIQVFDTSFYLALYAKGRLKENALISPTLVFLCFPIVYTLFKIGASPVALSWAYLIDYAILALVVKPILIVKISGYEWKEILSVLISCLKVTVVALPIPLLVYFFIPKEFEMVLSFIILSLVGVLSVVAAVWFIGFDFRLRSKILGYIRKQIRIF